MGYTRIKTYLGDSNDTYLHISNDGITAVVCISRTSFLDIAMDIYQNQKNKETDIDPFNLII